MADTNQALPGSYVKSASFTNVELSITEVEKATQEYLNTRKSIFDYDPLMQDNRTDKGEDKWVRNAFLVAHRDLEDIDRANTAYTTAHRKYTDTSPGGNYCINPRPMFTPYADPPDPGMLKSRQDVSLSDIRNTGMGQYYSESQDDNSQIIHMRFGVTAYTGLTTFFTGFFSYGAAKMAKTGRSGGFFNLVGKAMGMVLLIVAWPLLALTALGYAARFFLGKPSSRYAYLKPTMHMYWGAVQSMLNAIVVNRGLYPNIRAGAIGGAAVVAGGLATGNVATAAAGIGILGATATDDEPGMISGARSAGQGQSGNLSDNDQLMQSAYHVDDSSMKRFASLMPDVFSSDGHIDVYAIAGRSMRIRNLMEREMAATFESSNDNDFFGYAKRLEQTKRITPYSPGFKDRYNKNVREMYGADTGMSAKIQTEQRRKPSFTEYIKKVNESPWFSKGTDAKSLSDSTIKTTTYNTDEEFAAPQIKVDPEIGGKIDGFVNALQAEYNDGTAFASFRVDYTGAQGDSFSSQANESEIGQKINSISSSAREMEINLAGGNIGGAVGEAMSTIGSAVGELIGGAMDMLNISGLLALKGDAFVDIPKHWVSSTGSLPRAQYTMTLISPYGNIISQITNIYLPLCMILAGGLPLATGRQSYTAPFMLELYDRGRTQVRYGMIDQISISRGTSNLGFNREGVALAYEVSFSVVDLSSVIAMPINNVFSLSGLNPFNVFDDDTLYTDYINVLGALSMSQQVYKFNKIKLNAARQIADMKTLGSPHAWASFVHDMPGASAWDMFYMGTDKI